MTDETNVPCRWCQQLHRARIVARDEGGFPETLVLLEPCPHEERAKLGEAAGRLLAMGLDSGLGRSLRKRPMP